MTSTSSSSLANFDPSEWDVLRAHPQLAHVPHRSGIEALAFSVAAQVPDGRWVANRWLEELIAERFDEQDLARVAARQNLSLVVCSERSHGAWAFTTYPARDPLTYHHSVPTRRPVQVLVKRVSAGFRAMRRKSWKMGDWDPLPLFGCRVDDVQKRAFRERSSLERLNLSSTVSDDHRRRRRHSDPLEDVANDYRRRRVDPQTFACSSDEVRPLIPHWRADVRAGSYRPLQSWAFHWFGFLSMLTPEERERPFEATVDGLDRLAYWERWDSGYRRHISIDDAVEFPGSLHYGE